MACCLLSVFVDAVCLGYITLFTDFLLSSYSTSSCHQLLSVCASRCGGWYAAGGPPAF